MRSGDPDPSDDLRLVIEAKQHAPVSTIAVVSEAAGWLKAALKGAGIAFHYSACEQEYYGYAAFTVLRRHRGEPVGLELMVAEINDRPFVFADVRSFGRHAATAFPYFGDLHSEDHRELLMHYVADFVLGTEPPTA